jgi:hypothetical protein
LKILKFPRCESLHFDKHQKGENRMSLKILQINFKFNVPRTDYESAVSPLADPVAEVSGLLWKIWLMNEAQSESGGILLFEDEISMNAYINGPITAQVTSHPALSDFSVKHFDVMDEVTAITRGPVKQTVSA